MLDFQYSDAVKNACASCDKKQELEWRPDDWFNRHTPKVLEAGFMRQGMMALANAYEDGASQMLAARDKWWIEQVENLMKETTLRPLDITYSNYLIVKWEQFKQSLEAKE